MPQFVGTTCSKWVIPMGYSRKLSHAATNSLTDNAADLLKSEQWKLYVFSMFKLQWPCANQAMESRMAALKETKDNPDRHPCGFAQKTLILQGDSTRGCFSIKRAFI